MNEDRSYTVAAGKDFGPLTVQLFFGDRYREGRFRSRISQCELRRHRSCVEDGLVPAVIGRSALVARLGVGGGRSQAGLGQLHL